MIQIISSANTIEWDNIVGLFRDASIYQLNAYANSFKLHGDGEPILFYFENDEMKAMHVVMKRKIVEKNLTDNEMFDFATPYGYGGPIFDGLITEKSLNQFALEYRALCSQEKIISEFIRFDPCINNAQTSKQIFDISYAGENVVWFLDDPELMWNNLGGKNRNVIRKARNSNVNINHGLSEELINKFIPLYNSTMDYDKAKKYYYFNQDYYGWLLDKFQHHLEIFSASLDNEIIAMAMVFKYNKKLHYHLSAFNRKYSNIAPNNLLLYEIAVWGHQNGYKLFQLGGGVGGSEDGLLRFKKSFTNQSTAPFYVGKVIHDQEKYDYLVSLSQFDKENSFFPLYRSNL